MRIVTTVGALREALRGWRQAGDAIAFVPTMGNLHAGHLKLVEIARSHAPHTVASIFVNPLQFGAGEDYQTYPRTLEADSDKLRAAGLDILFTPSVDEMYPPGALTRVDVPPLSTILCGAARPGHFSGVATVVAKLFNQVQPTHAVFGAKDFQQLLIVRRMVRDLSLPIDIIGVPTQREPDGLAMSSRNGYLTAGERVVAPRLFGILQDVGAQLRAGRTDYAALEAAAIEALQDAGFRPDYVSIRQAEDLAAATAGSRPRVVLAAAWLGRARLIDNLVVDED